MNPNPRAVFVPVVNGIVAVSAHGYADAYVGKSENHGKVHTTRLCPASQVGPLTGSCFLAVAGSYRSAIWK